MHLFNGDRHIVHWLYSVIALRSKTGGQITQSWSEKGSIFGDIAMHCADGDSRKYVPTISPGCLLL